MRIEVEAKILLNIQDPTDMTPEEIVLEVEQDLNEFELVTLRNDTVCVGVRVHMGKLTVKE